MIGNYGRGWKTIVLMWTKVEILFLENEIVKICLVNENHWVSGKEANVRVVCYSEI